MYLKKMIVVAVAFCLAVNTYANNGYHLKIQLIGSKNQDSSLTLQLYDKAYLPNLIAIAPPAKYEAKAHGDSFVFNIPNPDSIFVFSLLSSNGKTLLNKLIAEAGDSLTVQIGGKDILYVGKGALKYSLNHQLTALSMYKSDSLNAKNANGIKNLMNQGQRGYLEMQAIAFKKAVFLKQEMLSELQNLNNLPTRIFNIMSAELIAKIQSDFVSEIFFYYLNGRIKSDKENYDHTLSYLDSLDRLAFINNSDDLNFSPTYIEYLTSYVSFASYLNQRKISGFDIIDNKFSGFIREKLTTDMLLAFLKGQSNPDSLLKVKIPSIAYPPYRSLLSGLTKSLSVGNQVFNFSLPDVKGNTVSLSDFKGKVIFLHFWFKGCEPCAFFYRRSLSFVEDKLKDNPNIVFISVSLDRNYQTWINAIKEKKYTGSHSVNLYTNGDGFKHEVCKAYYIAGAPSAFLIDQKGELISLNTMELGGGVNPDPEKLEKIIKDNIAKGNRQPNALN